jgi:hypothetical protein
MLRLWSLAVALGGWEQAKTKKLKRANKSLDARRMARDQESRVGLHRLDWTNGLAALKIRNRTKFRFYRRPRSDRAPFV